MKFFKISVYYFDQKKYEYLIKDPLYFIFILHLIIGRQFDYERALEIVQDEQYLDDVDFDEIRRYDILKKTGELNPNDEIKRYDIQKRTGNSNQKANLRKGGLISEGLFTLVKSPVLYTVGQ